MPDSIKLPVLNTTVKKSYLNYLLAFLVILIVVIIKYPHLFLPHFWDEAWSYSPAVQYMYEHNLGLMPSLIPAPLSKGHPLFFYFLFASWMRIFGDSLFVKHFFALIISLGLLISVFFITKRLFNPVVAFLSVLFTAFQTLFLAQSSMMLPEMLLALFTITTLYFYLQKNKPGYLICGAMLVLTKETGIFLILVILIFETISFLTVRGWSKMIRRQLTETLILVIPFFIFGLHLIAQKLTYGWFFYPEHLNYVTGIETGNRHLGMFLDMLFVRHGQAFLVFLLLITLLLSVFQKDKNILPHKSPLLLMLLFMIGYLLLSSFNFSSPRYLLSVSVIFAVLCAYFLYNVTRSIPALPYLIGILAAGILFYFTVHIHENGDYDLGYVNAVKLQKQAVRFCEQNEWYNISIYCNFLMRINLTEKTSGFLSGKKFSHIVASPEDKPDILIFNNIENDPLYVHFTGNDNYKLIQTFYSSWMWVEFYSRKK